MIIVGVIAAILGIVYAGLLYISGEKDKIEKAKKMLPTIGKGFVIMLAAWFIVYQILSWLASNDGVGQAVKKILEG
jgi:ABC-type nickel/cobalt efflux system permease component RcnA